MTVLKRASIVLSVAILPALLSVGCAPHAAPRDGEGSEPEHTSPTGNTVSVDDMMGPVTPSPTEDPAPQTDEPTQPGRVDVDPPADAPPVDDTPVDETPVDEAPVDETPVDETPVDETPVDDGPLVPSPPFDGCDGDSAAHRAFNELWRTLDAEYAVFDARLPATTSWADLGESACASLRADMSESALFDHLISLVRNLDDGQLTLSAAALGREESAWTSAYPHYDQVAALEFIVEAMYLDTFLTWSAQNWFAWGSVGNIGYISITSMDELSPSGDESTDRAAARAAIDAAVNALSWTSGIVVDVRANEGGWDSVALDVAKRFAGERAIAWSEQQRAGAEHDAFTPWEDVWVEASEEDAYAGPVVVLTSRGTFGAAESFVLAMSVRDNVTVMGERTSGHFSDATEATLDNGWELTFSGERYRAADGEVYEGLGVPVDVPAALDISAIALSQDPMFVSAVSRLTD
jgi:hypothetical protein